MTINVGTVPEAARQSAGPIEDSDTPESTGEVAPSLADVRRADGATIALVAGQAVTELPKDLYIPPEALEVFLETFEGPLDLLLYLIRRQNLDILDVSVSEITTQYMGYIDLMTALQLELVGEYLVMAAMLAEIKSRMLLPRPESVVEDEEDERALNEARKRRGRFNFKIVGIPPGSILSLAKDETITCEVVDNRKVSFDGEIMSLSNAALAAVHSLGYTWKAVSGPEYWQFEGQTLDELRKEIEEGDD